MPLLLAPQQNESRNSVAESNAAVRQQQSPSRGGKRREEISHWNTRTSVAKETNAAQMVNIFDTHRTAEEKDEALQLTWMELWWGGWQQGIVRSPIAGLISALHDDAAPTPVVLKPFCRECSSVAVLAGFVVSCLVRRGWLVRALVANQRIHSVVCWSRRG